jgi:acyl-CoA synthetase (AMP-forming)/AMP-acid ligase II
MQWNSIFPNFTSVPLRQPDGSWQGWGPFIGQTIHQGAPRLRGGTLRDNRAELGTTMDPIAQHAQDRPDALALIQGEGTRTWAELDRRANQAARVLKGAGVGTGDVVAVALRNSIEFFELIGGAGRLGATVMPVSFRNMRDEVEYLVQDARAVAVFGEPDNRDVFSGLPSTIYRGEQYEALLADEADGSLPVDPRRSSENQDHATPKNWPRPWARLCRIASGR